MIIGSCGYGATGSSVLTDLLKEYDDVQIFDDFEFTIPYKVDGLQDLEFHLMEKYSKTSSGDYAIKRFLEGAKCYRTPWINKPCDGRKFYNISKDFISKIEQLNYRGIETKDVQDKNILKNVLAFFSKKIGMKYLEKLLRRRLYLWPARTIHFSIKPENFYEESKNYIDSILLAMGADLDKPICLDQPFEGNNPRQSFPFFSDPYAIVIDRDPRDLYLEFKYTASVDGKFFPHSNVEDFIVYYKNLRKDVFQEDERVIKVRFEEFVYEYDKTIKKIESFLRLGEHKCEKKFFKPERSAFNTQLIKKHPEDIDDIKKIEEELTDFLFPFDKYPSVNTMGKSFYGAERKFQQ